VWLVGMMGAGKSAVGRVLARRLGRRFVDADAEIERAAGCSISEIFADEGEAGFRAREHGMVEALVGADAVVALGGGAIAQPALRELLAGTGTLVYLRARPETLLARLREARDRPLLAGLDDEQRLARVGALLAEREAVYASADLCIDTDGLPVEQVAERVLDRLGAAEEEAETR
jgi:shikimate kinase